MGSIISGILDLYCSSELMNFSRTVLLYNNMPMETVSELLGHTKLTTTQQSYGKIVQRKVGEEMKRLKQIR